MKVIFSEELVTPQGGPGHRGRHRGPRGNTQPPGGTDDEQLTAGEDYFSVMEQSLASLKDALS